MSEDFAWIQVVKIFIHELLISKSMMVTLREVSGLWRRWVFTLIDNEILGFYFGAPEFSVTKLAVLLSGATFIYFNW